MSAGTVTVVHSSWTWDIQCRTVTVRPGSLLDADRPEFGEDTGHRYRYKCRECGRAGAWRKDGNAATEAADQHLYTAHGMGD